MAEKSASSKPKRASVFSKLSKRTVLVLCSLLPFVPGYLSQIGVALVYKNPKLILAFYLVQFVTVLLWGVLSWRLYKRGEIITRHVLFLHLVPAGLAVLLAVQELTGGYWLYITELVPKMYYAAIVTPGFLIANAILPGTEWLGYIVTLFLMVDAAILGCLLKRYQLKKKALGTKG